MTVARFIQKVADRLGITYEQAQHISLVTAAQIFQPREIVDTTGESVGPDENEQRAD